MSAGPEKLRREILGIRLMGWFLVAFGTVQILADHVLTSQPTDVVMARTNMGLSLFLGPVLHTFAGGGLIAAANALRDLGSQRASARAEGAA